MHQTLEETADFPFSIWLPLRHAVNDWPLAVCDGSSISSEHLIETDTIRRNYQGANMYMLHSNEHKWYFLRRQQVDEALIFKQFDTAVVEAGCEYSVFSLGKKQRITDKRKIKTGCPHSSFYQSNIPVDALPRESIELRALVFTYHEDS